MFYLYAGLGLGMLAAVAAMFQVVTSLTGQQVMFGPAEDLYLKAKYSKEPKFNWPINDQLFITLIEQDLGDTPEIGSSLCKKITDKISEKTKYSNLTEYFDSAPSKCPHPRLLGACVLQQGLHRVLIVPTTDSHRLYSCIVNLKRDGRICGFEKPYQYPLQGCEDG